MYTHTTHTGTHTQARHIHMQVVPADYAYVLHTSDPVTGTSGQAFGEAVVGMGEALVGNYPGRCVCVSVCACFHACVVRVSVCMRVYMRACLDVLVCVCACVHASVCVRV